MKQIDGQMSFLYDVPKVPIYHFSRTYVWCECPTCKNQRGIGDSVHDNFDGQDYIQEPERCPSCGQKLLWDWDMIHKVAKYSKDYKRRK